MTEQPEPYHGEVVHTQEVRGSSPFAPTAPETALPFLRFCATVIYDKLYLGAKPGFEALWDVVAMFSCEAGKLDLLRRRRSGPFAPTDDNHFTVSAEVEVSNMFYS